MTDTVQLALIAAVPPTIAAMAALAVSIHNGMKAAETGKKADTIIEKAAEIHTLTNSNLSAVTKSLEVAQARIDGLEKLVAQNLAAKKVADDLAAGKK